MVRITESVIFFAGALCLLSLAGIAHSVEPEFIVIGKVNCDVCRANVTHKLTEPMKGATVRLECVDDSKTVTYSVEAVTDAAGGYTIDVPVGDHEEERCDISLVKSSVADCSEIPNAGFSKPGAITVQLTSNSGMHDKTRNANPLSYLKDAKNVPAECASVLKDLKDDLDD